MENKKQTEVNKELKKLKECVKEKDVRLKKQGRRIKKIEEYFWLRNRLILSTILTIICASPVVWIASILRRISVHRDVITMDERGVMLVGILTIIIVPIAIWLLVIGEIWEE